jgi:exodeoxyribonuclease VII large subunit
MRRAGMGALFEAFLRLRDRLEREGLFAPALKRPIPAFPRTIGVVTSPAAAALRDVLTTLARRNPSIAVVVYPAPVQGEGAPARIVAALDAAGRRRECDVLILCRGGGSIEDLWAFNDERVARAIRASPIPVVVGVGHETDVTIADFAVDLRAPTPSGAAELASPARDELRARIDLASGRLRRRMTRDLETRAQLFDHLTRRLVHPGRRLDAQATLLAQLRSRLGLATERSLERSRWHLRNLAERARRRLPALAPFDLRVAGLAHRMRAAAGYGLAQRAAWAGIARPEPRSSRPARGAGARLHHRERRRRSHRAPRRCAHPRRPARSHLRGGRGERPRRTQALSADWRTRGAC